MTLRVIPEGLAATSAAVDAITAQLAAVHAAAAPVVSVVVPPAADPVSPVSFTHLRAHET
ncbi:PE family protein [Mycobacterium avium subsp. paratuberculosis]|nr:PE family protein [Mycobacterium avium subsp. paratuberculosis]